MHALQMDQLRRWLVCLGVLAALFLAARPMLTQAGDDEPAKKKTKDTGDADDKPISKEVGKTTYDQISPVILGEQSFEEMRAKDKAAKPKIMARQMKLLEERYDLKRRVDEKVKMSRGKPIPVGP